MKFYTIWKKHTDSEAVLVNDLPLIKTKKKAFAIANKMVKDLIVGSGDTILVRHIKLGDTKCEEYVFSPDD